MFVYNPVCLFRIRLVDILPDQVNEALRANADDPTTKLRDTLKKFVGIDHLEAAQRVLVEWELPAELVSVCATQADTPLAKVCELSSTIATAVYQGCEDDVAETSLELWSNDNIRQAIAQAVAQRDRIAQLAQSMGEG